MHLGTRWSSLVAALAVCSLLLCSCTTTDSASAPAAMDDGVSSSSALGGGLFAQDETANIDGAQNRSWIVDAPHSAALEPENWLDYTAYYLGEIALAPVRIIQLIIDGS